MSTNYYAEAQSCGHCGRAEQVHIGSSYRLLRSYDLHPIVGSICTWAQWREWLTSDACDGIVDEYGARHDVAEFIARWTEARRDDALERVMASNASWREQFGTDLGEYVDDEGFILSTRAFS